MRGMLQDYAEYLDGAEPDEIMLERQRRFAELVDDSADVS